jgi:hypothetical protein
VVHLILRFEGEQQGDIGKEEKVYDGTVKFEKEIFLAMTSYNGKKSRVLPLITAGRRTKTQEARDSNTIKSA